MNTTDSSCYATRLVSTTASIRTQSPMQGTFAFSEQLNTESIPARSTRFMHIDGDHGRWALHNDLDIANRVVTAEGMVVLDDFFGANFAGVTIGAIEWLARNPLAFELILVGFSKGYLLRPRMAEAYYQFIRDGLPAHLRLCGIEDFSLWRTDDHRACGCCHLAPRQYERDLITRDFASGPPDRLIDGKIFV